MSGDNLVDPDRVAIKDRFDFLSYQRIRLERNEGVTVQILRLYLTFEGQVVALGHDADEVVLRQDFRFDAGIAELCHHDAQVDLSDPEAFRHPLRGQRLDRTMNPRVCLHEGGRGALHVFVRQSRDDPDRQSPQEILFDRPNRDLDLFHAGEDPVDLLIKLQGYRCRDQSALLAVEEVEFRVRFQMNQQLAGGGLRNGHDFRGAADCAMLDHGLEDLDLPEIDGSGQGITLVMIRGSVTPLDYRIDCTGQVNIAPLAQCRGSGRAAFTGRVPSTDVRSYI